MDCYISELLPHLQQLDKASQEAILPSPSARLNAPAPPERNLRDRSPVSTPIKPPARKRKPASAGGGGAISPRGGGGGGGGSGGAGGGGGGAGGGAAASGGSGGGSGGGGGGDCGAAGAGAGAGGDGAGAAGAACIDQGHGPSGAMNMRAVPPLEEAQKCLHCSVSNPGPSLALSLTTALAPALPLTRCLHCSVSLPEGVHAELCTRRLRAAPLACPDPAPTSPEGGAPGWRRMGLSTRRATHRCLSC